MATTIISNIAVFSDSTGHGNQSHLVYAVNQQRFWLLYIDTKTATTVKTMVSSSNDLQTATWSAGTASGAFPNARALSTNDQRNLSVVPVPSGINANDAVHITVNIEASGSAKGYHDHVRAKFTSTASITWETWLESTSNIANTSTTAVHGTASGVSTSGVVHTCSNAESGSATSAGLNGDVDPRVASNVDTGPTWANAFGTGVATDDGMAFASVSFSFAPLASAAMLLIYANASVSATQSGGLKYQKYASGTTWPVNTGSADVGIGTSTQDQNDWCLCAVDTTHVYAFRRDSASSILCRMYNGTSWSTPTSTIPAAAVKAGSGLFAATDGTSLWLFWIDSTGNGAVKYAKGATASGTISFDGTATTLDTAGATARNFISGNPIVSNNQIGVIYTAVNSTNFDIGLSVLNLAVGGGGTFRFRRGGMNGGLIDATGGGIAA